MFSSRIVLNLTPIAPSALYRRAFAGDIVWQRFHEAIMDLDFSTTAGADDPGSIIVYRDLDEVFKHQDFVVVQDSEGGFFTWAHRLSLTPGAAGHFYQFLNPAHAMVDALYTHFSRLILLDSGLTDALWREMPVMEQAETILAAFSCQSALKMN